MSAQDEECPSGEPDLVDCTPSHWGLRHIPDIRWDDRAGEILRAALFTGHVILRLLRETDSQFRLFVANVGVDKAFDRDRRKGDSRAAGGSGNPNPSAVYSFWRAELLQRLGLEGVPAEDHEGISFVIGDVNKGVKPRHVSKLLIRLTSTRDTWTWLSAGMPRFEQDTACINICPKYFNEYHTINGASVTAAKEVRAMLMSDMVHEVAHLFRVGLFPYDDEIEESLRTMRETSIYGEGYYCLRPEIYANAAGMAAYNVVMGKTYIGIGGEITRVLSMWYYYLKIFRDPLYVAKHPLAAKAARRVSFLAPRFQKYFTTVWRDEERRAKQRAAALW